MFNHCLVCSLNILLLAKQILIFYFRENNLVDISCGSQDLYKVWKSIYHITIV